jgi:hypothetical protein
LTRGGYDRLAEVDDFRAMHFISQHSFQTLDRHFYTPVLRKVMLFVANVGFHKLGISNA